MPWKISATKVQRRITSLLIPDDQVIITESEGYLQIDSYVFYKTAEMYNMKISFNSMEASSS
jgi:regulator of protease activity HflC (stomatin/prohibitin superfamily)